MTDTNDGKVLSFADAQARRVAADAEQPPEAEAPASAAQVPAVPKATTQGMFEVLLEHGIVAAHIMVGECTTPPSMQDKAVDVVNWSTRYNVPDFEVDDRGVRGTLSFSDGEFLIDVPWGAIVLLTSAAVERTALCVRGLVAQMHNGKGGVQFLDTTDLHLVEPPG